MEIAKWIITNNKNVLAPCLPGVWRRQCSARQIQTLANCLALILLGQTRPALFQFFLIWSVFCETLSSLSASTFITNGTLSSSLFLVSMLVTAKWEDCDIPWLLDRHGNESGRMSRESVSVFGWSSILQCRLVVILEVRLKSNICPFFWQPVLGSTNKLNNLLLLVVIIIIICQWNLILMFFHL